MRLATKGNARAIAALLAIATAWTVPATAEEPVETALRSWVAAIDASPDWLATFAAIAADPATGNATLTDLTVAAEKPGFQLKFGRVSVQGFQQSDAARCRMQQDRAVADFLQDPGNQCARDAFAPLVRRNEQHAERRVVGTVEPAHDRADDAGLVFGDDAFTQFLDKLPVIELVRPEHRQRQPVCGRYIIRRHPAIVDGAFRLSIVHAWFPLRLRRPILPYRDAATTGKMQFEIFHCLVPKNESLCHAVVARPPKILQEQIYNEATPRRGANSFSSRASCITTFKLLRRDI